MSVKGLFFYSSNSYKNCFLYSDQAIDVVMTKMELKMLNQNPPWSTKSELNFTLSLPFSSDNIIHLQFVTPRYLILRNLHIFRSNVAFQRAERAAVTWTTIVKQVIGDQSFINYVIVMHRCLVVKTRSFKLCDSNSHQRLRELTNFLFSHTCFYIFCTFTLRPLLISVRF